MSDDQAIQVRPTVRRIGGGLLDLQQRFRELGRIRIGAVVPTGNGKTRPAKLDTFRLTSHDQGLLEQAATLYGGTVRPWATAPTEGSNWELITETDRLPIEIPPGEILLQNYELWKGGGCVRRCDGHSQLAVDKPCACPADLEERQAAAAQREPKACKPVTRFSVLLPDITGVGVWRLETKGYRAAEELPMTFELIRGMAQVGAIVPAFLRITQRTTRGGGEKKNYVVPVLEVDQRLHDIAANLAEQQRQQARAVMPPVERKQLPATQVARPVEVEHATMTATTGVTAPPDVPPDWILELPEELTDPEIVEAINAEAKSRPGATITITSLLDPQLEEAPQDFRAAVRKRLGAL